MEKFALFMMPLVLALTFSFSSGSTKNINETNKEEVICVQDVTTYYFIRHAEKESSDPTEKDPKLTIEGEARAENWAKVFKEVPFDAVYSTDYNRTRATAQKVAESQGKEVQIYDPSKLNDPDFQSKTQGKTVLVVGHSNTTPAFVNQILKENIYASIDDKESGSLFIVNILPDGTKTSQVLYIN